MRPRTVRGPKDSACDARFVRLQEILEADDVGPDHLEHGEAAVAPKFLGFRQDVILSLVQQDEQPGLARLLMIAPVALRPTADSRHADAVGRNELWLSARAGIPGSHS